jgi:hypothetical protein
LTFYGQSLAGVGLGGITAALMAFGGTWATAMTAIASFYVVLTIQSGDLLENIVPTGLAVGFAVLLIMGA